MTVSVCVCKSETDIVSVQVGLCKKKKGRLIKTL